MVKAKNNTTNRTIPPICHVSKKASLQTTDQWLPEGEVPNRSLLLWREDEGSLFKCCK